MSKYLFAKYHQNKDHIKACERCVSQEEREKKSTIWL